MLPQPQRTPRNNAPRSLFSAICLLVLSACSNTPIKPEASTLEFIVVRHAEKMSSTERDPALSPAGELRAQALQARLAGASLQAVYSSDTQRTRSTALPTALAHKLPLQIYDAKQAATALAQQLRQQHHQGRVLVVGHSNTVPDIVAALCSCTTQSMEETEYDRYSSILIDADGKATLNVSTYGAPSSTH